AGPTLSPYIPLPDSRGVYRFLLSNCTTVHPHGALTPVIFSITSPFPAAAYEAPNPYDELTRPSVTHDPWLLLK
ncbi:MAG: hypothetical protein JSU94_01060, partial [Phycisphaerales bacterium]